MRFREALAAGLLITTLPAWLPSAARAGLPDVVEMEPNDSIATANSFDFEAERSGSTVEIGGERAAMDSDFFVLTNLVPGAEYEVTQDVVTIGIGIFDSSGQLLDSVAFAPVQVLFGIADGNGELIVAVCGRLGQMQVLDCTPNGVGLAPDYRVTVPEPAAGLLAAAALLGLGSVARTRRR